MALPASGNSLSLNQMHIEVGGTSGTTCSLNDSDIRGLTAASGRTINSTLGTNIDFADFYGASASVADYSTTLTAGHTTVTTTVGYSSITTAARGFLSTSASLPLFGTTTNNIGSLSSYSNSNYFGGNTLHGIAMMGTVGSTTGTIYLYVATSGQSNSNSTFKEIVINGTTYTRSSGTYTSYTYSHLGNTFDYTGWTWSNVQASLTNSSTTLGNYGSSSYGPFPISGSTCTVTFKRN